MANLDQLGLPNGSTYNFKDNTQERSNHRHYETDLVPIAHKTYASTSYYSTNDSYDNSTWYFMSVKPDEWYKPWRVKFKVHSYCPSYASYHSYTWSTFCGRSDGIIYANWNERQDTAHYYIAVYALKKAGFDAGYGHAIGVSIRYGGNYQNSAYYRTFEVDYYECENCTVTILDTPVKWASWTGTGTTNYNGISTYDAVNRGLYESGDSDTIDSRITYFGGKTGSKGVWAGSLFMEDSSGTYQNICTASDGTATSSNRTTATTKKANTNGFKPFTPIYYCSGNYNPNTNITGWGNVYSMNGLFDTRYAFNTTLTANSLTPYAPLYLVGTINSTDGLFYLDTTWWTQTPTNTSKIYILVGGVYDSTTSNCRMSLYEHNVWYKYDGSKLVEICGDAKTVNGHTVAKDVPSNAVFTDNNTTYTFANGTNGFTVTPSGGSAQTVTVTPSISNNVTGSGTSGYIAKFNGANTITNGPAIGSGTTKFLREDGTWQNPPSGSDVNVTQTATSTSANYEVLFSSTADNTTRTEGARKNSNLTFNPSTGNLQATQLNGVAIGSSPKFTDNNTTYTFANGTNGFTVTPSGGSAQTVTVTPSITNNVTGSGTSGYLTKFNGGNTITNGPQLGSSTTTFLSNAGTWLTPDGRGNKIFTTTPTTPYKVGDLYIEDDNNIYVCNTARSSGSYVSDDWDGAVAAIDNDTMEDYVDSVLANAFGTNGGNVLWRLDANGKPYEFLVTDTPGNLNGKIWRWDGNGLRFSASGYSGSYITLINSNGRFAADYLTGTFNASNLTIQNFSADKISGGIFTRGNSSNNSGTIIVKDSSGVTIAEVDNAGFKFYGAGNVGSRPYFIFNNSVGFAGYNASGALTFQISTDEFHIQKLYADAQLTIGGYLKAVPVNNGTNKGISFVKAY